MTDIRQSVFQIILDETENKAFHITDDTPLIGESSIVDSMKLIQLCLALEDFAEEKGFEFDWTSDQAMSRSRSMFLSVGSLISEFINQMDVKK